MKKIILLLPLLFLLSGCNNETDLQGHLNVPDALFYYSAEGKGIPCVAFTGSENIGQNLLPDEYLNYFNLIHADPKTIGEDIIPDIKLDDIIDDIEKVRQFIGADKISILGHSMFSTLPLLYAAKYPDNTAYAICTGGAPSFAPEFMQPGRNYWTEEADDERKKIRADNFAHLNELDKDNYTPSEWFIITYNANIPYRFKDPEFDASGLWDGVEINIPFVNHFYNNIILKVDDISNYKKIKAPVMAVSGKYDFGLPHYLWDPAKPLIKDFTQVNFENAGHNPMIEIPYEFTETIINWVKTRE